MVKFFVKSEFEGSSIDIGRSVSVEKASTAARYFLLFIRLEL